MVLGRRLFVQTHALSWALKRFPESTATPSFYPTTFATTCTNFGDSRTFQVKRGNESSLSTVHFGIVQHEYANTCGVRNVRACKSSVSPFARW
jgi:hypothetical protein